MIDRMVSKYHIDLSKSYIIGDSTVDIQTGVNAGIEAILVETGEAGKDRRYPVCPDEKANNLLQAVELILQKEAQKKGEEV